MTFQHRMTTRQNLMRLGYTMLILANCSRLLLRHAKPALSGPIDVATGVLFGIAIGALLLSLRRNCTSKAGPRPTT